LAWVSGCRLCGCCIGIPLSWRVRWAPVLAFCRSLSVASQSPICPVPSWHVCWAPVLAFRHSLSIASQSPIHPVPLAPSFHHSHPCCSVGGAVVVVVIVVVIPSLSPSPIPHRSHLHPHCHALIASPWPSLSSSFLSSPCHLLLILPPPPLTCCCCCCCLSVFGVVMWQGVLTWLGGAVFSLRPCLVISGWPLAPTINLASNSSQGWGRVLGRWSLVIGH